MKPLTPTPDVLSAIQAAVLSGWMAFRTDEGAILIGRSGCPCTIQMSPSGIVHVAHHHAGLAPTTISAGSFDDLRPLLEFLKSRMKRMAPCGH